jgi:ABC-type molybdate transport system ATPase subunit
VVVMNQGRVAADGPTSEVFSQHELLAGTHLEPTAIGQLAALCGLPKTLLTVEDMVRYVKKE